MIQQDSNHPLVGGVLALISLIGAYFTSIHNLDVAVDIVAKLASIGVAGFAAYINLKIYKNNLKK